VLDGLKEGNNEDGHKEGKKGNCAAAGREFISWVQGRVKFLAVEKELSK